MAASEEDLVATWQAVRPLYSTGQQEAALIRLRTEAKLPDIVFPGKHIRFATIPAD